MGFEEDYREGLRDKRWGRANKAFATGMSENEVSRLIKTAVTAEWRDIVRGQRQADVLRVAGHYSAIQRRAATISQSSLFPRAEDSQALVDDFVTDCDSLINDKQGSHVAQRLVTIAVESLIDTLDGLVSTTAATQDMLVSYLRNSIEAHMQPAMGIAGEKRRESPAALQANLDRTIAKVPLQRIADKILDGKGAKLRVQMPRPTVEQFAAKSLLFRG